MAEWTDEKESQLTTAIESLTKMNEAYEKASEAGRRTRDCHSTIQAGNRAMLVSKWKR